MRATLLDSRHFTAIKSLLLQDEVVNLFLLGVLEAWGLSVRAGESWFGVVDENDDLQAVCYAGNHDPEGRPGLLVPWGDPQATRLLGTMIAAQGGGKICVGPREACDALWLGMGSPPAFLRTDQRLYACETVTSGHHAAIRTAAENDLAWVVEASAHMNLEDLGFDPRIKDPLAHTRRIQASIRAGRTFVSEENGHIRFKVDVGTACSFGAQVGGTWVDPQHRGKGLGTLAMRAVCSELLNTSPRITLHVRENNEAAIRCYEAVGFQRSAAYRLIVR